MATTYANFRAIWAKIGPPWTRRYWGERLWQAMALVQDLLAEGMTQAARAGWLRSDTYPVDALPIHSDERRIPAVPGETAAEFRDRLANAWHIWGEAGTPTFANYVFEPFGLDPADTHVFAPVPDGWLVGSPLASFSRFTVLLDDPSAKWAQSFWGTPLTVWGMGLTWGSTATQDDVRGAYKLIWNFKAAHEVPIAVVLAWGWCWGWGNWGDGGATWGAHSIYWEMGNYYGGCGRHPGTWGGPGAYGAATTRWGTRLWIP